MSIWYKRCNLLIANNYFRMLTSCEDYLPVIKAGCDMTVHQHITATSMLAMQSVLIDNNQDMHLTSFQNQTCKNHK